MIRSALPRPAEKSKFYYSAYRILDQFPPIRLAAADGHAAGFVGQVLLPNEEVVTALQDRHVSYGVAVIFELRRRRVLVFAVGR